MTAYSSSRSINVQEYENLVRQVYTDLLVNMRGPDKKPWVYPSPTLHSFLSHSSELIRENDDHGMGRYSNRDWRPTTRT